jgi:signal transduction histidine kinase
VIATTASGHRVLDPWLALLAGDRVWSDGDDPPEAKRRVAAGLELVGLAFVVSLVWVVVVRRVGQPQEITRVLWPAVVATVAGATLAVRPAQIVLGHITRPAAFLPRLFWRGACFLALLAAVAAQMPGWPMVAAWAIGIVVGADVILSTWVLGIETNPLRWWRHFLASPLHFGVIGALAAVALAPAYRPQLWSLFGPYLALHLGLVAAMLTCRGLISVSEQLEHELDAARASAAVQERRHRAHWLHDDVLAEIRLTTLRVQSGVRSPIKVVSDLEELDHRLRMRQLDELYEGGAARLADVLQPHVRRAQTLGIHFTAMPTLDAAGRRVDQATGRLFGRAVSVLMSNAINAGARTVALGIDADDHVIQLRVADDAGGFDLDQIRPGHGLDQLADELGRDRLRRIGLPGGSLMIAEITLGDSGHAPFTPATSMPATSMPATSTPATPMMKDSHDDDVHSAR